MTPPRTAPARATQHVRVNVLVLPVLGPEKTVDAAVPMACFGAFWVCARPAKAMWEDGPPHHPLSLQTRLDPG